MKRKEVSERAGMLMKLKEVKKEIQKEKSIEPWARRYTHHFTTKVKRMLFEDIDNIVWSGDEKEITGWCERNKVYDEITEEIEEIWKREVPDDENVRLNRKMSGRRPSECAITSTHTRTSSALHHSENTEK